MLSPASELRFAARRLRRTPSFAAAVVVVLALGIGAATAVFSLVSAILIEPLPFPESDRLVRLTHTLREAGAATVDQSDASLTLYQGAASAFDGVAAWRPDNGILGASSQDQAAIRVRGARVTSNLFDVLGVRPALGRGFAPGEDRAGANHVVVLSHRMWQERLGGDPNAVGRQIFVNDVARTVLGIMPRRFAYPADDVELWIPLARQPESRSFGLVGIARLKHGVSAAAAQADLARVLGAGALATPQAAPMVPQVQPLRDSIVGPVSRMLWLVFGSAVLLLLVACTSAAGLFLARTERLLSELAVRRALGSGLGGLLALTLSESVLLCAIAGGAGVVLATLATGAARHAGSALSLPRLGGVGVDTRVLLFAFGVTALCSLAVSVVPLLRLRRASLPEILRGTAAGSGGGRSRITTQRALVVAEVALGVVLVAASGLMTRSFLRLSAVELGFRPDHIVTSTVLLPFARYGEAPRRRFFSALVQQTRAIPGVHDVGLTDWVPLSGSHPETPIEIEQVPSPASLAVASVDSAFFNTLGIPLLRGRAFSVPQDDRPPDEVLVTRAFAERYWPGASPLRRRVRRVGEAWHTIVGEVGDVHYDALERPAREMVYFPIVEPGGLKLVVRTDAGRGQVLSDIRRIVRALDPAIPTFGEGSLRQLVDNASARTRTLVVLLATASVVTSLLAAIGLYGVLAYTVSTRRREIGVRIALGAMPRDVRRMVVLVGLRLAGAGIAIGLLGALLTSPLLRGLLYGVAPTDLVTLSLTPAVVLAVAWVATWVPARNAAALHPSEALRSQ